jgi:DNA polymerase III alpha subunit
VTTINNNSQLVHTVDEVLDMLLRKGVHGDIVIDDADEIAYFEQYCEKLTGDIKLVAEDTSNDFHEVNTNVWHIPDKYLDINVREYLIAKCKKQEEIDRVNIELNEFESRGLEVVLNLMIYLVDHFTENNIVWGVGRGSSAASFCLYLIGINRVNSLKYNLDINEFFK